MGRRTADALMVTIAVGYLCISIVRAFLGMGTLPYAFGRLALGSAANAHYASSDLPSLVRQAWGQARDGRYVQSWWAGRRRPWLTGDDYVAALASRPPDRTLGCLLGAVVARERDAGLRFDRLVMPPDDPATNGQLVGTTVAASFIRADGQRVAFEITHPGRDFTWVSGVPVETRPYRFMLDDAEWEQIERATRVRKVTDRLYIADPEAVGAGSWVLMCREVDEGKTHRDFLLVPAELADQVSGR